MAYEPITLPDVSDDEMRLVNRLLEQLEQKATRNLLRASFYDGKHAVAQVGTIIPPQYYRLGITLGWSAKAVDMLARRCRPDRFFWPDGDLSSIGMDEFAEGNHLMARIKSAEVSSLIHGVSFLVSTKGDTSKGEPAGMLHVKDALNATGDWNGRRGALDNFLSVTSRGEKGKVTGLVLYVPNEIVTAEYDSAAARWQVERKSHTHGVPVEAMVYKPSEQRPFGTSRISRPIMSIQERALRSVIRMEAHNDVYTIPDLWMLGADEAIFKNADGSQKASWQVVMGRIKAIPDDEDAMQPRADVKQFPASSPEPHIKSYKQLAGEFAGEASIPLTSLGVSDMSNPTSADSYLASREDLVAEAEGAVDDWRLPARRGVVRSLAIANDLPEVPDAWRSIEGKWIPPQYLSRAAQADAGMKQLSAVPWLGDTEVGLELLGLTEQQIKRALAERRRVAGRQLLSNLTAPSTPPGAANGSIG